MKNERYGVRHAKASSYSQKRDKSTDPDGRMHEIALPDGQIQVEDRKMVRQKDGLAKHDPPCAGPNGQLGSRPVQTAQGTPRHRFLSFCRTIFLSR
jgi:hypothetical protein